MFFLVEFSDNSVATVSMCWLKEDSCYWPNTKEPTKLAKAMQVLKSDWKLYKVYVKSVHGNIYNSVLSRPDCIIAAYPTLKIPMHFKETVVEAVSREWALLYFLKSRDFSKQDPFVYAIPVKIYFRKQHF